jgi:hypothetical protein
MRLSVVDDSLQQVMTNEAASRTCSKGIVMSRWALQTGSSDAVGANPITRPRAGFLMAGLTCAKRSALGGEVPPGDVVRR